MIEKCKAVTVSLSAVLIGVLTSPAHACEPCPKTLNFDSSAEAADLVIIGERTDYSPEEAKMIGRGPDTVQVLVLEVLKGSVPGKNITVNAWDGMCRYGVVVDAAPHVMILKLGNGQFDTVESGCGVSALPLSNGTITVEGRSYTPSEIQQRIGKK